MGAVPQATFRALYYTVVLLRIVFNIRAFARLCMCHIPSLARSVLGWHQQRTPLVRCCRQTAGGSGRGCTSLRENQRTWYLCVVFLCMLNRSSLRRDVAPSRRNTDA